MVMHVNKEFSVFPFCRAFSADSPKLVRANVPAEFLDSKDHHWADFLAERNRLNLLKLFIFRTFLEIWLWFTKVIQYKSKKTSAKFTNAGHCPCREHIGSLFRAVEAQFLEHSAGDFLATQGKIITVIKGGIFYLLFLQTRRISFDSRKPIVGCQLGEGTKAGTNEW